MRTLPTNRGDDNPTTRPSTPAGGLWECRAHGSGGTFRRLLFVLAVLSVVPIAWIVAVIVLRVRQMDEYQRKLLFPGLAVGFTVAMVTTLAVGTLSSAGFAPPSSGWIVCISASVACSRGDHKCPDRRAESLMENTIRAEREQRGWTQAVLGAHLDVSRQTIVALETGRYDPSLPLAFQISRLFGRRIEELFTPAELPHRVRQKPRLNSSSDG